MTDESQSENGSPENETKTSSWNSRLSLILVVLVLGVTVLLPGIGVLPAFVIALVAAVLGRKVGSFRDMGFRSPDSWPKLLGITFLYGIVIQLVFGILIEPLLERITGSPVDISVLDPVRGNFGNYLIMTIVGWTVGGFLEEFTFRGYVVTRVRELLGGGPSAAWIGVLAAAIPFGIAHMYQGPSGMVVTGLAGFIFGAMYLYHGYNLWYPIFTHGFVNTVAMLLVYLDVDQKLGDAVFSARRVLEFL